MKFHPVSSPALLVTGDIWSGLMGITSEKVKCVRRLREARQHAPGNQQDWLPALVAELKKQHPKLRLSERNLLRWHADYENPSCIERLIDKRGGRKNTADPACWDFFKSYFLQGRRFSVKQAWRMTRDYAEVQGLAWCGYESCRRKVDVVIPPQTQARHRNPKKYRSQYAPYIEQAPERHAAGTCWLGDHAQLDFWCEYDGKLVRPWITAWQDWRTRRIVGWTMSLSPDSSTILSSFRKGLKDPLNMGGPDLVWIDNGKDYDSLVFHGETKRQRRERRQLADAESDEAAGGVFNLLQIEAHFSLPYNPTGKARIENRFGQQLHNRFDKLMPSYCGAKPENKPEDLNHLLKNKRHLVPDWEHVRERLGDFIEGYNLRTENGVEDLVEHGQRLSPNQVMARWCTRQRAYAPGVLDQALQHWHRPVVCGRNGITIAPAGYRVSYGQFAPELRYYKGRVNGERRKLHVGFDPDDLRTVKVYDADWKYVCEASMNNISSGTDPISKQDLREQTRENRRYQENKKGLSKHRWTEILSNEEKLAQRQFEKKRERPAEPDRMKLVQTPLDDASKAIEKERLRKAAGAEGSGSIASMSEFFSDMANPPRPPQHDDPDDELDILSFKDCPSQCHEEDEEEELDLLDQQGELEGLKRLAQQREGGDDEHE